MRRKIKEKLSNDERMAFYKINHELFPKKLLEKKLTELQSQRILLDGSVGITFNSKFYRIPLSLTVPIINYEIKYYV